ncbi:ribosome recycling factor, partial [Facklamia hominis]
MADNLLKTTKARMDKSIEAFQRELG